jgi:hypothetical protein
MLVNLTPGNSDRRISTDRLDRLKWIFIVEVDLEQKEMPQNKCHQSQERAIFLVCGPFKKNFGALWATLLKNQKIKIALDHPWPKLN